MEETVEFACAGKRLFGVLHVPEGEDAPPVVLMVTGGPQTRVGSHRFYVQLSRHLCARGVASLRFDYEGLGDSEGGFLGYEYAAPSLRAALDFLFGRFSGLESAVIWSLCDGSAVSAFYGPQDRDRIAGMVLCNPFTLSEQRKAQTYLKHYYLKRLFQPEFFRKLASFRLNPVEALRSFLELRRKAAGGTAAAMDPASCLREEHVAESVVSGLVRFRKPVRLLLSTDDLTAMAFQSLLKETPATRRLLGEGILSISHVQGADHTFTHGAWKTQVCRLTLDAVRELAGRQHPQRSGTW